MKKLLMWILCIGLMGPATVAQSPADSLSESAWLSSRGYIKSLQGVWFRRPDSTWLAWNTLHARWNASMQIGWGFSAEAGLRALLTWGSLIDKVSHLPFYYQAESSDPGFFDLISLPVKGSSFLLKTQADRLFLQYQTGPLNLRLGRQRINQSMTLIWNPNDIINTWSWFDFDYEERPGADALKAEVFTSATSSLMAAVALDSAGKTTSSLLWRSNFRDYDYQLFAGQMPGYKALGTGWAGDIRSAGFRGEATLFLPSHTQSSDSLSIFLLTAEVDYTFTNSFYLMGAFLYNSQGHSGPYYHSDPLFSRQVKPYYFTPARLSLFTQASYPIHPLINASLAIMLNAHDFSGVCVPSLDISLANNLQLLLIAQSLFGPQNSEYGSFGNMIFMRLKWGI